MSRSKSSKRWLAEHHSDEFVKEAKVKGYRSRAYFKLRDLDERHRLFRSGARVLDLGAAPGGWSQYLAGRVGEHGMVIATDLLPMLPLDRVRFIQGDFRDEAFADEVYKWLGSDKLDAVCSDMAPNMTGSRVTDQARGMYLAELALEAAERLLDQGGDLVVKVFQGEGQQEFLAHLRKLFEKVVVAKPESSRSRSREVYVVARSMKR